MIRYLVFVAFLVPIVYGQNGTLDRDTFKNCSRVEFCATLRPLQLKVDEQYAANVEEVVVKDNVARIPLANGNKEKLVLEVTLLTGYRIRLKVLEVEHDRFEVPYVLDGEPEPVKFKAKAEGDGATLTPNEAKEDYHVIVTRGPPFTVEFYYQNRLDVVFTSKRLVMRNSNASRPFTFDVEFVGTKKFYGLSHHTFEIGLPETANGSMDPIRLKNNDVSFYEINDPLGLYGSIPVIYSHAINWTSGIFVHNAAEQFIDIEYGDHNSSAYFMVESGTLDLFVLLGPSPREVVRQYTSLTGVAHLPQIWVLGYHQCRWSYFTQEDAKSVIANFDKYNFPLDVLWLDDGHSNHNRYFEWNPENYSDPIEMQKNISATGRRIVTILDPHIKIADDYAVYNGAKGKYFIKWSNGSDFQGNCWPGLSSWIDFLNPEASDYYGSWYRYDRFNKSTPTLAGAWNDMNEPSVFDTAFEWSMPYETVHFGNVQHRNLHNMYGFLQVRSTHHGLFNRDNGTVRPFILTRSHFAGTQRYAAMWTGDNSAQFSYMRISYSECLTTNLLGQVLCGADVAGFFDPRQEVDTELLQRWYQAAVWLPFFRGHSNKETPRHEPYLFDEDIQEVLRHSLRVRYSHIPAFYTLFFEHTTFGDPIIRPFFYHYPEMLGNDEHLLLGRDILAAPAFESEATSVTVTLPGTPLDIWYRVDDLSWTSYAAGGQIQIPVDIRTSPYFYRGGSVISRKDIQRRSTTDMVDDPYTIYVNLDHEEHAVGYLYADDFYSFDYQNYDNYLYVELTYIPDSHGLNIKQLSGNSTGINMLFQRIIINSPIDEDGLRKLPSTSYTITADGTPLESIDIAQRLRERSGSFIIDL